MCHSAGSKIFASRTMGFIVRGERRGNYYCVPVFSKKEMRYLDREGLSHSVWTFQTPFIGAVCNCDQNCMAYLIQYQKNLAKVMWKGEYVASIEQDLCKGCRQCLKRCPFDAVHYDRRWEKCRIETCNCYGCGICRPTCPEDAIVLFERGNITLAVNSW